MMPKLSDIYKQVAEQTASQSPEDAFYSQPITPNQQRNYRAVETETRRIQNQLEMEGVDVEGELAKSKPGMMSTLLDPIFDMLQIGQFVTAGAALEIQKGGMAKEVLKRAASEFANALPGFEVEDVVQIGNEQFPKATRPSWSEVLKKSEMEFFNNKSYGKWSAAAGGLALDILLDPTILINPVGAVAKVPEVASFLKGAKTLIQESKYSKPIYEDLGRKFVKDFDLKEYARRNPEKAASVTRFIENMGAKEAETEAGLQAVRDKLLNVTKDMNAAEFRLMHLFMQDPKMLREVVEIATLQAPERKTEILTRADELRKFYLDLGEKEVDLGLLSPAAFEAYKKDKIYVPGREPSTPKGEAASDELRARLGFAEPADLHPSTSGEIGRNMQQGTGAPIASKEKVFKTIVERLVSGTPTDLDVTLAAKRGIESVRWQATKRFVDSVISDPDVARVVPKGDIANLFDLKQEDLVTKLINEGMAKADAEVVASKQFDELSGYVSRLKKEGFGLYRPLRKGEDVFVMPEPFIKELDMTDKLLSGKDETKKFLKQWNSLQTIWKGYAVLSPGFHARNMFSNWWNNALGGVGSPDSYYKAYLLQRGQGGDISVKVGDKIMQAEEIMSEAIRHGVVGTGIVNKDLSLDLEKQILNSLASRSSGRELGEKLRKGGEKFSLAADVAETAPQRTAMDVVKNIVGSENALLKGNRLVGRAIENNARLAHFINKLEKGHTIQQAARSTKKYLFDYSELTQFEREVMKAVLPFYAWMRHNIPLQFQSLVQKPGRYAALSAKPIQEIESLSSDWQDIPTPDYFQEIRAVRLPKEAAEGVAYLNSLFKEEESGLQPTFLNPNLPFQDINRLNLPDFMAGLSPLPKMLMEQAPTKGFSFFLDRDIERYPGESSPVDVLGTGVTLTGKQESMSRSALPTYGKIQRLRERYDQGQFASQLLTEIAGLKAIQLDLDRVNRNKTYNKREVLRNLKRRREELGQNQ